ncbi:MAG: LptF/LptG family permease, partial [Vulcanimicrobiaceae bacterium]
QIIYHTSSLHVEPQFIRKDPDTNNVFYVSQLLPDNKTMEGVQIFRPGRTGWWNETVQANTGTLENGRLELHDAIQTRYNDKGYVVAQQKIKKMFIGLPLGETAAQFMSTANSDPWTMNSKALGAQVTALKSQGIGGTALANLEINLADKLAWPFACVVGVLLSLPLALRFGKRGRMVGMALAMGAFFAYYLLVSAFAALGRNNAFPPELAAWIPNIAFGVSGLILLWLEEH